MAMKVWIVENNGSGGRSVYASRDDAVEAVTDPDLVTVVYANTVQWRDDYPDFADLYHHDSSWKPEAGDLVGTIEGIEVK